MWQPRAHNLLCNRKAQRERVDTVHASSVLKRILCVYECVKNHKENVAQMTVYAMQQAVYGCYLK